MRQFLLGLVPWLLPPLAPQVAVAAGLEIQGYPAGVIVGASQRFATGDRAEVGVLAGWNFTDRRDFGEHEDEHGGGPGLGAGAWRWSRPERAGWGIGARVDLWWLDIDWEDGGQRGKTEVAVIQPTARGGHAWRVGEGSMRLEVSLSLGAEINVSTRGEDVGEGAILLAGIAVSR